MVEAKPFVKDIAQRWQKVRESSVQFVRSGNYSQDPGRVLLMEFIFADSMANKMWWEAGQRLEKALDGFLTLPSVDRFRKGGLVDDAVIEKRVRVEGQGFRMRGQIDLAWRENGRVAVADWKSGGRDGADSDLQLLAYALGVQHRFECELDELDLFRVELGTGNIVLLPINQQEAQARAEAYFRGTARRFVTAQGVAEPDPPLRVGAAADLSGLGPLFSGKYYVAGVRHIFDGAKGLRTEFTAERPGLSRP